MKKQGLAGIVLLAGLLLNAEVLRYKVVSPLMGTLGTIKIDKKVDKANYRIDVDVRTKGIASTLTGKRKEHYRSEGVVEKGVLKSRHLRLERKSNSKRQIDEYRIDPAQKKVSKVRLRWKKGKQEKKRSKILPYYTDEDLLTLYFNAIGKILDPKSPKHREILAVGAEKIDGKIVIDRLEGKAAAKARKELKVGDDYRVIVLSSPQKIGGKRNRRFTVAVDQAGLPHRIRFVAIPVVGEILVEREGG
jgi:hypothetical protein